MMLMPAPISADAMTGSTQEYWGEEVQPNLLGNEVSKRQK